MGRIKFSRRGLKICCGVTAILFIIILVVVIVLSLTIFKPKQPKITTQSVTLEHAKLVIFPVVKLNVTLGIALTIDNRNYGGFKYEDSTSYVSYRGTVVAEAPIEHDRIPARGKLNVSTSVEIVGDKLILDPQFKQDCDSGIVNFTSSTILHGKVILLNFWKKKATTYSACNISIYVIDQAADSVCHSRVKF
ncbi:hypothetical protein L1049_009923 [Liquidambar formosana]|uniref:Late embryogenesis abundant protein LEA-2 subgroup domain-containing protein n=1 Tax=Liquidambar formosana TaxID=63359 RepID=A0AAP0R3V6_LIQFO